MKPINRKQLFIATCFTLFVTSLSFGIRAGILNALGTIFQLSASVLENVVSTPFGELFLAVIIGMKLGLLLIFLLYLFGKVQPYSAINHKVFQTA